MISLLILATTSLCKAQTPASNNDITVMNKCIQDHNCDTKAFITKGSPLEAKTHSPQWQTDEKYIVDAIKAAGTDATEGAKCVCKHCARVLGSIWKPAQQVCADLDVVRKSESGKTNCLENGQPDNDCCALPGTMSCAGKMTLRQSTNVCWKGNDASGKSYTAYNYACYPTTAPAGHDPSKCLEDGNADDDCCAIQGHSSCSSGYKLQNTKSICFANQQFTAYSYFCLPANNQNQACEPSKCTSPGPDKNTDCWAGNGEPFTCADGYKAKMTGNTAPYQGKTWKEYTCCPNGNTENKQPQCVASACREYTKDNFDNDCCGVVGQTFCADGYTQSVQKNGCENIKTNGGLNRHIGTCCTPNGEIHVKAPAHHNPKACRENGKFDNDCCAVKGTNSCASGYQMKQSEHYCFKNDQFTAYDYFCIPQTTTPSPMEPVPADPSKCRELLFKDNDCCAVKGTNSCADGYELKQTDNICFSALFVKAYKYSCHKPAGGNVISVNGRSLR